MLPRSVLLLVFLAIPVPSPSLTDVPPSLDIKVDQVGYPIGTTKLAFLVRPATERHTAYVLRRSEDGKTMLEGSFAGPSFDKDSGDQVFTADFSSWNTPGTYYLDVPGVGRSWKFSIAADLYRRTYYLTARAFYGQRCGTAVDLGPEFPGYQHDACHLSGAYHPSSGREGNHVSSKGWHDAGDYGRYVVNSGISTATLLWAFELWGQRGMRSISLHLPESGNGTPDLLNEARWNIDWLLTMQDSDGGVWHKQTSDHFCGFIAPQKDTFPSLVVGVGSAPFKTSCATADFAAVTAIAARVFIPYDRSYADRCLTAARNAWRWLESHEEVPFHNPPGITTGEYGDEHCADEQLWAAAELSRTTREPAFEAYFAQHYTDFLARIAPDEPPSYANMAAFALWTYALGKGQNGTAVKEIESRSVLAANTIVQRAEVKPYRTSMTRENYVWGSNGMVANYGLQLLVANQFRNDHRFVEAAIANVHYLFGCNPFSLSYVTQLGSHSVQHIHHRPSASSSLPKPWPGLLSGGPNPGRQDPEMQKLVTPGTPASRAFLDLQDSYASNEIAINWNAPLVFVLAGLLP